MNPGLRERLGRACGLALFAFMVARQFWHLPARDAGTLEIARWALVTLLFLLFFLAYARRRPALALSRGWSEILLPFVCAGLPFAVILGPSLVFTHARPLWSAATPVFAPWSPTTGLQAAGLALMALGDLVTVAGMIWLGRSFSITSEARELVRGGPYRLVRHPLYAGEILATIGYAVSMPSAWSASGALLFTVLQCLRARVEERKLATVHPGYEDFRREVGFLFPRLSSFRTR